MIISLDKLNRRETDKIDLNFSQKIDTINYCDSTYKLTSPINVNGKISNTNKGMYLDVDVNFTVLDDCSRCLDEVEVPVDYSIQGFLVKEDYDEDSFEDYDAFIYDGQEVNLLDLIERTVDFNLTAQVLCSEECEGLCPECGGNLNKKGCSCDELANDEEIID
ncbi:MAG: YceD family protein, partial [Peptostreptococcaceae bacterium]